MATEQTLESLYAELKELELENSRSASTADLSRSAYLSLLEDFSTSQRILIDRQKSRADPESSQEELGKMEQVNAEKTGSVDIARSRYLSVLEKAYNIHRICASKQLAYILRRAKEQGVDLSQPVSAPAPASSSEPSVPPPPPVTSAQRKRAPKSLPHVSHDE